MYAIFLAATQSLHYFVSRISFSLIKSIIVIYFLVDFRRPLSVRCDFGLHVWKNVFFWIHNNFRNNPCATVIGLLDCQEHHG